MKWKDLPEYKEEWKITIKDLKLRKRSFVIWLVGDIPYDKMRLRNLFEALGCTVVSFKENKNHNKERLKKARETQKFLEILLEEKGDITK